jgi:uncharacterized protein (TIGR00255 family)
MIRPLSMTSFGRGEHTDGARTWTTEIRSVNHRFCDIKARIPRKYAALEEQVKKMITATFSRGHIDVSINYSGEEDGAVSLKTDLPLAQQYYSCLIELNEELSLASPPNLAMIASFREVISSESQEEDLDGAWESGISQALSSAIGECTKMRETEGGNLKQDLQERLTTIGLAADKIEKMIPQLIADRRSALEGRLNDLLDGIEIDPQRLAQEVAVMIDKSDVTEELVRLQSHRGQFASLLDLDEPTGRRLDFLLQEFLREINTLASKISNSEIAHIAVELKNELEKMREQVQNLE